MKLKTLIPVALLPLLIGCAATSAQAPVSTKTTSAVHASEPSAHETASTTTTASTNNKAGYETVDVAGYTAHLAPAAQRHPKRHEAIAAVAAHLTNLQSTFPAAVRDQLRHTSSFWFTERTTSGPLFHPDAGGAEGKSQLPKPELANGIEIPSITLLLEMFDLRDAKTQDELAMDLAASYFMHLPAPPWKETEEAFALAKTNLITAKLGSDPLSYFSALSAAYFGRMSLPPDRAALRAADPRGVALVARTWQASEPRVAQR